jgi:methanogenesis imperfect marker protein 11
MAREHGSRIVDPYIIHYPQIVGVADPSGSCVEVVEFFDCVGGAMWAKYHYRKSPLVESARTVGATTRYILKTGTAPLGLTGSTFAGGISGVRVEGNEIAVSYIGLGGGGVGASICRSTAKGVSRCTCDPSGGGKVAGSTVWLPRRERVLIGIDDTDTPDEGATWTLAHNIAKTVEDDRSRYLSHTLVQLFPVPYKTKNCVATVCEFATSEAKSLVERFQRLLGKYTLSERTGMGVYRGFDPSSLLGFARRVKHGEVTEADFTEAVRDSVEIVMGGRGKIGAVAAIPFYTDYDEALLAWTGNG